MNNELLSIDKNSAEFVEFTNTVLSKLDKHATIKRKYCIAVQKILCSWQKNSEQQQFKGLNSDKNS